ncbi:MAG TPA: hypothetical protein VFK90_02525 [Anaeromyxobacter sp.]|nr:hypothetical protein [Anaeromyxobacter sp.]
MPFSAAQPARPASAAPSPLPRWSTLKRVADSQRQAMFALLAGILAVPLSLSAGGTLVPNTAGGGIAIALVLLVLATRIWMIVAVYRVTKALGSSFALLWALGAFLPNILGLIVLAICSSRATKRLKDAGLKVGLMGAKLPEKPPPGFPCEELAREFA